MKTFRKGYPVLITVLVLLVGIIVAVWVSTTHWNNSAPADDYAALGELIDKTWGDHDTQVLKIVKTDKLRDGDAICLTKDNRGFIGHYDLIEDSINHDRYQLGHCETSQPYCYLDTNQRDGNNCEIFEVYGMNLPEDACYYKVTTLNETREIPDDGMVMDIFVTREGYSTDESTTIKGSAYDIVFLDKDKNELPIDNVY